MKEIAFTRNRWSRNHNYKLETVDSLSTRRSSQLTTFGDYAIVLYTRHGFFDVLTAEYNGEVVAELFMGVIPSQVSSVFVRPDHGGKNLGIRLYEAALAHYGKLRSSTDLSVGSSVLWKKLAEHHPVKLVVQQIDPHSYRVNSEVHVDIIGWKSKNSYWWPVVSKSGKPVPLYELLKSKDPAESNAAAASFYEIRS